MTSLPTDSTTIPSSYGANNNTSLSGVHSLNEDGSFILTVNNKRYLISSESSEVHAKMEAIREKFLENVGNNDENFISCIEKAANNTYQCKLNDNQGQTSVIFCEKGNSNSVVKEILLNPKTIAKTNKVATNVLQNTANSNTSLGSATKQAEQAEQAATETNSGAGLHEIRIARKSTSAAQPKEEASTSAGDPISNTLDHIMTPREKYRPKFARAIRKLSKLEKIDLNNKEQVQSLLDLYAYVKGLNADLESIDNKSDRSNKQVKQDKSFINLFTNKEFCKALDISINYFKILQGESSSSDLVKSQSGEITTLFEKIREKRHKLIEKSVKDLDTEDFWEKYIQHKNPVDASKNLMKIVHLIFNGIDEIQFENKNMSKNEKIEYLSNKIKSLTQRLIVIYPGNYLTDKDLVNNMQYLLKIAKSCSNNKDYFTSMSITKAIIDFNKTIKIQDKKTIRKIHKMAIDADRLDKKYSKINEASLLNAKTLHPPHFYNPSSTAATNQIDRREIQKPISFSSLKKDLTNIEIESNRLNKLTNEDEITLASNLTKEDFDIKNFTEVKTLKKIKFLQKNYRIKAPSKTEIRAWRSFYTKMRVVQLAYKKDPSLVQDLISDKDFIEISNFGIEKFFNTFSSLLAEDSEPTTKAEEVENMKNAVIETVQGYHTKEEAQTKQTYKGISFSYRDEAVTIHPQARLDILRSHVFINGQQVKKPADQDPNLAQNKQQDNMLAATFDSLKSNGYDYSNEALAKITDILASQTFIAPISDTVAKRIGSNMERSIKFFPDDYKSFLSQDEHNLVFTRTLTFNIFEADNDGGFTLTSKVKLFFNIIIPKSEFEKEKSENKSPMIQKDKITITCLMNDIPVEQTETNSIANPKEIPVEQTEMNPITNPKEIPGLFLYNQLEFAVQI